MYCYFTASPPQSQNTIEFGDQPVQSAVMFFPLPAFLFLTLYWVRWWAVQPPNLWYESLEA